MATDPSKGAVVTTAEQSAAMRQMIRPVKPADEPLRPTSPDSEVQTLGLVLKYPGSEAWPRAQDALSGPQDFFLSSHRLIAEAMYSLAQDGNPVELDSVIIELEHMRKLDEVGADIDGGAVTGRGYLYQLVYRAGPADESTTYYAKQVAETASKRRIGDKLMAWATAFTELGMPAHEVLTVIEGYTADERKLQAGSQSRFKLISALEAMQAPVPDYIVAGYIYEHTDNILHAPSQAGKSTVADDLLCCMALGRKWHGRSVTQADVVLIAAEDSENVGRRLQGWCLYNNEDPAELAQHFFILPNAIDLFNTEDMDELAVAIQDILPEGHDVGLIAIDTLSRCTTGGDTKGEQDALRAMAGAKRLREYFGGSTLILAHPGYGDPTRMRNSSSFEQAADGVLRLELEDSTATGLADKGVVRLIVMKNKSDSKPDPLRLAGHRVTWTQNGTGRELSALVIARTADDIPEAPKPDRNAKKDKPSASSSNMADALTALRAGPDDGLSWADWFRACEQQYGMTKYQFSEALRLLKAANNVTLKAGKWTAN